ncbi:MAG: tripartite tricarboxylate transporter substrate binding protein [Hyphomonadaceae bacterium]|nr:tripartite tricarboxylate transporter substrate binding protein [Hyphomonadaceae bacterium]
MAGAGIWNGGLVAAVSLAMLAGSAPDARAQTYPSQSITILVAAPAGGFADGVARAIGEKLGPRLGQSVIVENRGGAGGNLAARLVAQAKADGHTILVSTTSTAINPTLYKNMGYAAGDIRPVAIVGSAPEAIVVHPSNPANNLAEFVKAAKEKSVEFGTAGVGSGSYIAAEYFFKELAKVQTVHVPFQGGAPAVTAALGNHITAIALTVSPMIAHINAGRLKGIGIAAAKRHPVVPTVPTFAESGFPDFHAASWVGFFVPSKSPDAAVTKLNAAINESLKETDVQERLKRFGLDPMFGDVAQTAAFFKSEGEHWGKMVRTLGLSIN